jgi:hypothetical protein
MENEARQNIYAKNVWEFVPRMYGDYVPNKSPKIGWMEMEQRGFRKAGRKNYVGTIWTNSAERSLGLRRWFVC